MSNNDRPIPLREHAASQSAVREFLEGPSLKDALIAATDLAGTQDWLARPLAPDAGRGHGLDTTSWMRARFGLANP